MTQYIYQNTTKKNQFGTVASVCTRNLRFLKVNRDYKMCKLSVLLTYCVISPLFYCGSAVFSQTESPYSTFKRIKVTDIGSGPKINIQIDPELQAFALAPVDGSEEPNEVDDQITLGPKADAPKVPVDLQDWFWADIGTSITKASADRMSDAVLQLAKAPTGFYLPRAQHLNEIVKKYGSLILGSTISTKVSPALVLAVIGVESSGRSDATSSAGAQGLMQLIPDTAKRFGVTDSNDPAQNIAGGVAYLDWLLAEFKGDPLLALAAYNAGENAIKKNNGVPDYPETRNYVPKVVAAWQVARNLCASPPMLISEPCVFQVQVHMSKK
jgi:hypothetical protein